MDTLIDDLTNLDLDVNLDVNPNVGAMVDENKEIETQLNVNIFYAINSHYTPSHIFNDGEDIQQLHQTIEDFGKVKEAFSNVNAKISLLGENTMDNGIIIGNKYIELENVDDKIYLYLFEEHDKQYPIYCERGDYAEETITFMYKILVQFRCIICNEFIGNNHNQLYLLEKFRDRGWLERDDLLCENCE